MIGPEKRENVSMGSSALILLSSMTSTLNLFRESNQGALFASHSYTKSSSTRGSFSLKIESFKANKSSMSSSCCSIVNCYTSRWCGQSLTW